MNCDDIKLMISEYLDGELGKEKEAFLFTHLSSCGECREEFKIQNSIQHQTKLNQREVSDGFEKRLFASVEARNKTFAHRWITKPTPVYINYLLGVIVIAITLFSFIQITAMRDDLHNYNKQLATSSNQIKIQTETIRVLLSSLPQLKVTPNETDKIIKVSL